MSRSRGRGIGVPRGAPGAERRHAVAAADGHAELQRVTQQSSSQLLSGAIGAWFAAQLQTFHTLSFHVPHYPAAFAQLIHLFISRSQPSMQRHRRRKRHRSAAKGEYRRASRMSIRGRKAELAAGNALGCARLLRDRLRMLCLRAALAYA